MSRVTEPGVAEHAVAFTNDEGLTLHGVLHMPTARAHSPLGVILLSPGQKCRLGPWRSYVRLARRLAALGVPVLRFDFHGLGDSEGAHAHGQMLVDFNGFVQTGGLVGDVRAAARFFVREAGVTRFVFAGLCGGAATGLLASPSIPGVYGHVLVDLPVTISNAARQRYLESNPVELLRTRPAEAPGVLRGYVARLRDRRAWRRLLTGESDYRLLLEAVRRVGVLAITRIVSSVPMPRALRALLTPRAAVALPAPAAAARPLRALPAPTPAPAPVDGATEVVNQPTIDAFRAARAQGQRMFFLNSAAYHPLFDAYFGSRELPADLSRARGLGLLVVPESNHVLSAEHAQRALFEAVEEFVRNALADVAAPRTSEVTGPFAGVAIASTR